MTKIIFPLLLISNALGITTFVISKVYTSKVESVYMMTSKQESQEYVKLKFIISDPLYTLHLIILIFELVYFTIYLIFSNKRMVNYFGLATDKIATQSRKGYSSVFMELFFTFFIKGLSLIFALFFIIKSQKELSNKIDRTKQGEKLDLLKGASSSLSLLATADVVYLLCFFAYYIVKIGKVRKH